VAVSHAVHISHYNSELVVTKAGKPNLYLEVISMQSLFIKQIR
jgi:hypothetical protein